MGFSLKYLIFILLLVPLKGFAQSADSTSCALWRVGCHERNFHSALDRPWIKRSLLVGVGVGFSINAAGHYDRRGAKEWDANMVHLGALIANSSLGTLVYIESPSRLEYAGLQLMLDGVWGILLNDAGNWIEPRTWDLYGMDFPKPFINGGRFVEFGLGFAVWLYGYLSRKLN